LEEFGAFNDLRRPGIIGSDQPFDSMIERVGYAPKQCNRDIATAAFELRQVPQRDIGQLRQRTPRDAPSFASFAHAFSDQGDKLFRAFLEVYFLRA
jgi:hypothetical protein